MMDINFFLVEVKYKYKEGEAGLFAFLKCPGELPVLEAFGTSSITESPSECTLV